jgi:hypothetical protein
MTLGLVPRQALFLCLPITAVVSIWRKTVLQGERRLHVPSQLGTQSVDPLDQTINTSPTGSIDMTSGHVTLGTGSPVWINLDLSTDEVTNFLVFDYEFTSDADGLLSVYLDGELLGTFYERFALDGQQSSGHLFFEDDMEAGSHILGFRVDPLSDDASLVSLSGIEAGYMTVVPEPATLSLLALGSLATLSRRRKQ